MLFPLFTILFVTNLFTGCTKGSPLFLEHKQVKNSSSGWIRIVQNIPRPVCHPVENQQRDYRDNFHFPSQISLEYFQKLVSKMQKNMAFVNIIREDSSIRLFQ